MAHSIVRSAVLAVALLGLAGCGSDGTARDNAASAPPASTSTSSEPPATTGTAPGSDAATATGEPDAEGTADAVPAALRFEATTVAGEPFDGASVAGRPVVLWFWAPWCSVCASQAPEVSELAETYGDAITFVGVGGLDPDAEAIAEFAGDVPGLTHLSDPDGELYQRFEIAEQSSFVVLDAGGGEVLRTGYAEDDELADVVEDLAS